MRKLWIGLALTGLLFSVACTQKQPEPKAKYVFLFIGDGMGLAQVQAAELYLAAGSDSVGTQKLCFTQFPEHGLVTTYSANSNITCSSAAGTALATGTKTNNGVIGKSSKGEKLSTIAEKAKAQGFKVGIISSVSIDHATPASFYAHQDYRGMYYEISTELGASNFDYFGGGGFQYPQGKSGDKPNSFEMAKEAGYRLINQKDSILGIKNGDQKIFAMNPVMYPKGDFYWAIDSVKDALSLADFTRKGIEVVNNPKGFFMMVEGGKIDWAGHGNDAASNIHETLEFDKAVAEALNFYKQHPDETLILVTADHETGGLALGVNNSKGLDLTVLKHQRVSTQEFQRMLQELKESGKKVKFDDIVVLITEKFGLNNGEEKMALSPQQTDWLKSAFNNEFGNGNAVNPDKDYLDHGAEKTLAERVVYIMSLKSGIGWTTNDHSGSPVPIRAIGVGKERFCGMIDNTDIPKNIQAIMGF